MTVQASTPGVRILLLHGQEQGEKTALQVMWCDSTAPTVSPGSRPTPPSRPATLARTERSVRCGVCATRWSGRACLASCGCFFSKSRSTLIGGPGGARCDWRGERVRLDASRLHQERAAPRIRPEAVPRPADDMDVEAVRAAGPQPEHRRRLWKGPEPLVGREARGHGARPLCKVSTTKVGDLQYHRSREGGAPWTQRCSLVSPQPLLSHNPPIEPSPSSNPKRVVEGCTPDRTLYKGSGVVASRLEAAAGLPLEKCDWLNWRRVGQQR